MVLDNFIQGVNGVTGGLVQDVLIDLCRLFGLYFLEKDAADFLEGELISASDVQVVREGVVRALQKIRPNAVALVDAWDWSDFQLYNSALGRYDGNVYEALFESASREPLNQQDPVDGWKEHIYPMTHSSKL